jgi:hypothetical protein
MAMRWLTMAALLLAMGGAARDPGLVLELDRDRFVIAATDLRTGEESPALPVAIGSPAHPTPTGRFRLRSVIHNPSWNPGAAARQAGAIPQPPSDDGPMGVAKIPFAEDGSISLHGGAIPVLLGKPVSLGCVRMADDDLLSLLEWMEQRGALAGARPRATMPPGGESVRYFRRAAVLRVR